jgi:tripartite-type tricarboxylate transporter receptor subunit TctC
MISRRTALALAAALAVATQGATAQPQWPAAKPITIIVPFSAGGSVDASARLLATNWPSG